MENEIRHIKSLISWVGMNMNTQSEIAGVEIVKCIVLAEILEKLREMDDFQRDKL